MNPAKKIRGLVHDSYQELLNLYMESKHLYRLEFRKSNGVNTEGLNRKIKKLREKKLTQYLHLMISTVIECTI